MFPNPNLLDFRKMIKNAQKVSMAEAISQVYNSGDSIVSVPSVDLHQGNSLKTLLEDIKPFTFLRRPRKPLAYPENRLFIYRGAGTSWHIHHADETLLCQVQGKKIIGLLPSDDGSYEYLSKAFQNDRYISDSSIFDAVRDKINPLIAHIDRGDALYIPPYWWHGVEPEDRLPGISVSVCWRSPVHKIGDLRFPTVRKIWKMSFRYPRKVNPKALFFRLISLPAQVIQKALNK